MNVTRNGGVAYGAEGGVQMIDGGTPQIEGGVANGGMPVIGKNGTYPI